MNHTPATVSRLQFRAGDSIVVLYDGRFNGMAGRFVSLRGDPNWADIEERDGSVRPHPVQWLQRPEDLPDLAAICAEGAPAG
jgi:hypothetical protein